MVDRPPSMPGQMPSSFDDDPDFHNERALQKVFRKVKEEPLIPLGIGLTVLAFVNAYRALRRGDSRQANRMFRARVAAQGFTVIAMVAGSMYYSKDREKTKELRALKEQRDNEEKRQKWIRELEIRDEEDKALRTRLQERGRKMAADADIAAHPDPADVAAAESAPGVEGQQGETSGGMLGRMGLWSYGEKRAAEAADKVAESAGQAAETARQAADDLSIKPKNPKSSLGTLGEIMASKKKDASKSQDDDNSKK